MARKIAWSNLPAWARTEIKKAGVFGVVQITHENGSLSITNGIVRYNGVEVVPEGVELTSADMQEETISEKDLPVWALAKIKSTSVGGQVQMNQNGDSLHIAGGIAVYNGKRVIRQGDTNDPEFQRNLVKTADAIRLNNPTITLSEQEQADIQAIKSQINAIDAQISALRQEITEKQFKIKELEREKQHLTHQLPFNDRFDQLFH